MFNPISETQTVEHHRRELLRQARLQRLATEIQRDQAKLHERFLAMVGDLMVSGGSRLKQRYQDANQSLSTPIIYDAPHRIPDLTTK